MNEHVEQTHLRSMGKVIAFVANEMNLTAYRLPCNFTLYFLSTMVRKSHTEKKWKIA